MALCIAHMTAAQPAGDTTFRTLGIADGLRSNSVTCLLADSRGYLWIGTYQGINRYDGHQVKTRFPESSDPQLREVFGQTITALEEDAEGRIWIECESGAYSLYDTRTAQFCASAEGLLGEMGIRPDGRYKVKVGEDCRLTASDILSCGSILIQKSTFLMVHSKHIARLKVGTSLSIVFMNSQLNQHP